jgi:hypothetical protein
VTKEDDRRLEEIRKKIADHKQEEHKLSQQYEVLKNLQREAHDTAVVTRWYVAWLATVVKVKKQIWAAVTSANDGFSAAVSIAKATATAVAGDVPDSRRACKTAAKKAFRSMEEAYTTALATATSVLQRVLNEEEQRRAAIEAAARAAEMQAELAAERALAAIRAKITARLEVERQQSRIQMRKQALQSANGALTQLQNQLAARIKKVVELEKQEEQMKAQGNKHVGMVTGMKLEVQDEVASLKMAVREGTEAVDAARAAEQAEKDKLKNMHAVHKHMEKLREREAQLQHDLLIPGLSPGAFESKKETLRKVRAEISSVEETGKVPQKAAIAASLEAAQEERQQDSSMAHVQDAAIHAHNQFVETQSEYEAAQAEVAHLTHQLSLAVKNVTKNATQHALAEAQARLDILAANSSRLHHEMESDAEEAATEAVETPLETKLRKRIPELEQLVSEQEQAAPSLAAEVETLSSQSKEANSTVIALSVSGETNVTRIEEAQSAAASAVAALRAKVQVQPEDKRWASLCK